MKKSLAVLLAAVLVLSACAPDNSAVGAELDPTVSSVIACDKRDHTLVRGSVEAAWERAGGIDETGNLRGIAYDVPELVRKLAIDEEGFEQRCVDLFTWTITFGDLPTACAGDNRTAAVTEIIGARMERFSIDVTPAVIDAYCAPSP